tara:strand:+ start:915 stop:1187 length:273 start_codon:yes stop_codon:yes gene_type:complete
MKISEKRKQLSNLYEKLLEQHRSPGDRVYCGFFSKINRHIKKDEYDKLVKFIARWGDIPKEDAEMVIEEFPYSIEEVKKILTDLDKKRKG